MVQQEGPQSRVGAEAHLGSPEFNYPRYSHSYYRGGPEPFTRRPVRTSA